MVGMGYRSRITAVLTWRMSTQTRISPLDLGTTTKGDTYGVGPLTFSIMSSLSSSLSFADTCLQTWKGIRRGDWATGLMVSLMEIFCW